MADNLAPEAVVSAAAFKFAMAETTFGGDTVYVCGAFNGIITGSEGSRTYTPIVAGAGAVDGGTQRMTLASDDPAVAKLGTIDADTSALAGCVGGSELQVDIVSSAAIAVTDNSGSLTVDAPVGTPVFVRLSDGSSAITTLPVSLASVPSHAVTNAGTFVIQENGAALTALQLIDNLVLAEDAVHGSGDPGVQMLAVQKNADAALNADGDYSPLQVDSNGYLKVNIKAGAGSGGTASTDDAAFTAASGSGTPIMGFVTSDSVDSGDVGVLAMLANRQLKVTLYDSGGSELSVGGGTQYTEDAAAAANPIGNALMLVREDARAGSLTTTDGDNVAARGNNKGELYVKTTDSDALLTTIDADTSALAGCVGGSELQVDIVSSATLTVNAHAVTNAGTFVVQENGAALTALQLIDDIVYTDDTSTHSTGTSKGALFMAAATPTDGSVNANDIGAVAMTTDRKLHVSVQDALPAGTNAIGKLASNTGVTIGAVEIASAQTLATVTTVSTVTTCSTVTTLANGQTAHDSAVTGSPLRVGAKAETALSGITLVADGDATDLHAGVDGVLIIRNHANLEDITTATPVAITDGSSTSVLSAQGSGIKTYLTSVTIANSSATFVTVDLRDGTGGAVKWTFPVPATGGVTHKFDPPLPFSANTAVAADPSAAASTITVSVLGFKSKV